MAVSFKYTVIQIKYIQHPSFGLTKTKPSLLSETIPLYTKLSAELYPKINSVFGTVGIMKRPTVCTIHQLLLWWSNEVIDGCST